MNSHTWADQLWGPVISNLSFLSYPSSPTLPLLPFLSCPSSPALPLLPFLSCPSLLPFLSYPSSPALPLLPFLSYPSPSCPSSPALPLLPFLSYLSSPVLLSYSSSSPSSPTLPLLPFLSCPSSPTPPLLLPLQSGRHPCVRVWDISSSPIQVAQLKGHNFGISCVVRWFQLHSQAVNVKWEWNGTGWGGCASQTHTEANQKEYPVALEYHDHISTYIFVCGPYSRLVSVYTS